MNVIFNKKTRFNDIILQAVTLAAEHCGTDTRSEVEINYITAAQMRDINARTRGIDSATDVLSFPYINARQGVPVKPEAFAEDINPQTGNLMLGEIYLCLEIVKRQAQEYGHTQLREAAYLAVHGFLHLIGYDHIEDCDRVLMRDAEKQIISLCGK